jgi:hypothetical protein
VPDYPKLDEDLVRRAYDLSDGRSIHDLNGLVGCYRGGCSRIVTILADMENCGHLLAENAEGTLRDETRLRAWVAAQNVKRAGDYQP